MLMPVCRGLLLPLLLCAAKAPAEPQTSASAGAPCQLTVRPDHGSFAIAARPARVENMVQRARGIPLGATVHLDMALINRTSPAMENSHAKAP